MEARHLLIEDLGLDRFISLLFARLTPATREWEYINAGHPPGYVLASDGRNKLEMMPSTSAIGIDRDEEPLTPNKVTLEKGDMILLLTDGMAEARSSADKEFGEERTLALVRREQSRPASEIIQTLLDEVRRYSEPEPIQDDMTIVVIKL